jgi:2-haloacid dehalogenase
MKPVAMVFDLFGTLLNIGSLAAAAARYTSEPAPFVATWREKQLAYAFAATIMNRYEDFDALTIRALAYAAARHGLSAADRGWEALASEWERVLPYDDAQPALAQLRAAGVPCAVLTNGTPATARAALQASGMIAAIDVTLSVDSVRTYKPAARVYELATAHFATTPDRLVFVTANGWDATGAAEFGLRVAWCNRTGAPHETFGASPAWTIRTLHELAEISTEISPVRA